MKCFIVGGYVRDKVMGLTPNDRDWVVVGSSPEEMLSLGFQQVGADFPVFLHPQTGEEYALARQERKTGNGYLGFTVDASPTVTLEEDLSRRDFTMNAMAMDPDTGEIFDPFDGQLHIEKKVLVPTSAAFSEDPLRVLRGFRFASRFGFKFSTWVASGKGQTIDFDNETRKLLREGALNHLPNARFWGELEKVLSGGHDVCMYFNFLIHFGVEQYVNFFKDLNINFGGSIVQSLLPSAVMAHPALTFDEWMGLLVRPAAADANTVQMSVRQVVLARGLRQVGNAVENCLTVVQNNGPYPVSCMQKLYDALNRNGFFRNHNIAHSIIKMFVVACNATEDGKPYAEMFEVMLKRVITEAECINAKYLGLEGQQGKHVGDAITAARIDLIDTIFREEIWNNRL